jgi:hypothetical protein
MRVEFYKPNEKAPPRDGTVIVGIFNGLFPVKTKVLSIYGVSCFWMEDVGTWSDFNDEYYYDDCDLMLWTELNNFENEEG